MPSILEKLQKTGNKRLLNAYLLSERLKLSSSDLFKISAMAANPDEYGSMASEILENVARHGYLLNEIAASTAFDAANVAIRHPDFNIHDFDKKVYESVVDGADKDPKRFESRVRFIQECINKLSVSVRKELASIPSGKMTTVLMLTDETNAFKAAVNASESSIECLIPYMREHLDTIPPLGRYGLAAKGYLLQELVFDPDLKVSEKAWSHPDLDVRSLDRDILQEFFYFSSEKAHPEAWKKLRESGLDKESGIEPRKESVSIPNNLFFRGDRPITQECAVEPEFSP